MTASNRSSRGSALVVIVLLLVAVALAAAAFLILRDRDPDSSLGSAAKSEAFGGKPDAAAKDDASAARRQAGLLDSGPKKADKVIAFTVVCFGPDGATQPIANAEVHASPAIPTGIDFKNETIVRTDAAGVAQFTDMPYPIYDVSVAPDGYVPLRLRGAKDTKRLEFVFRRGTPFSGVLTSAENDAPVAGAYLQIRSDFGLGAVAMRIQAALRQGVDPADIEGHDTLSNAQAYFRTEAMTDAQGRFSVTAIPVGTQVDVTIDHDNFDPLKDKFDAKESSPVEKNYVLVPRTEVFGKVLADESGEPIVGAKVQAGESGIPPSAIAFFGTGNATIYESVTDANGAYRLKRIPRGKQSLYVRYPGYTDYVASFDVFAAEPYQHDIRLKRSATLIGQVVDSANNPLEGVDIYWFLPVAMMLGRSGLSGEPNARSAADGTFQLHGLPVTRQFSVLARHADFVEVQQDSFVLQPGEEMAGVTIMMNRGGQITGTVVDSMRQPLAGAKIVARPVNPAGQPLAPITTGPDGTFVIDNTQPATFEVACEAPGYVKATNSNVRDFATGVQFVLVKEAIYSGRFLDTDDKPLTKFRVRIRPSESFGRQEVRTEPIRDKEGKFVIKNLGPGLWDFEFSADGTTPLVLSRIALREGELMEDQELHAQDGASIGGVAKSTSGRPIAGGLVRMEFLESFSTSDKTYTTLQASTNSNGEFEVKNLLPGRYKVWCAHPAFAPSGEREVVVEEGPRTQIDFSLPKPASLRLVVRDREGNTVPSAQAWLFKGNSPLDSSEKIVRDGMVGLQLPKTDPGREGFGAIGLPTSHGGPKIPVGETGEITYSRREPGEWTIWVMAEGYYKYTAHITLNAGEESVHESALMKLQSGLSQKDAYRAENVNTTPNREKRRTNKEAKVGRADDLTPEQQKLLKKQRDGEELTADEMTELKEIRKALRQNEEAGGDGSDAKTRPGQGKGKGKGEKPADGASGDGR